MSIGADSEEAELDDAEVEPVELAGAEGGVLDAVFVDELHPVSAAATTAAATQNGTIRAVLVRMASKPRAPPVPGMAGLNGVRAQSGER